MSTPTRDKSSAADPKATEGGASSRHSLMRKRIEALIEPMQPQAVHELYSQMNTADLDDSGVVRAAFIERLNKFRPQRVRRLFSELFVNIWIDDPILLRSRRHVPGAVQRIDVAALWHELSRTALTDLASEAQALLDQLATTMLVNEAMTSPEALALQDKMRLATIRALDQWSSTPATAKPFLDAINRHRLKNARVTGWAQDVIVTVDRGFLSFVREYLAHWSLCTRVLTALPKPASLELAGAERRAQLLLDVDDQFNNLMNRAAPRPDLRFVVPLTYCHSRLDYHCVAQFLHETGGGGPNDDVVTEALVTHFEASCRALVATLENALRIDERPPGATIRLSRQDQTVVEEVMARIDQLVPALVLGGVLEKRLLAPQISNAWEECTAFLTGRLARTITQRITAALLSRSQPTVDHKNLVWLIRLIWWWYFLGRRNEFGDQPFFPKWQTALMEDIQAALNRALKSEQGEQLSDRFDHLLRLNEFADAINLQLAPLLSVSNLNIVSIVSNAMRTLSPQEATQGGLVREYIAKCREEVRKLRRWQSQELTELIRLAETLGL